MKRYEVSIGNSHRGENKSFWFYTNALFFARNNSSPFVSIIDRYSKTETEYINWIDIDKNIQYVDGKPIKTTKMRLVYDGENATYYREWSKMSDPAPDKIIDNGHTFVCFAINNIGDMYWCL